jgi:hypothetical protein
LVERLNLSCSLNVANAPSLNVGTSPLSRSTAAVVLLDELALHRTGRTVDITEGMS